MWTEVFCHFPFTRLRVTSEGWVAFCCFMRADPVKPIHEAYLGNLLESSFDDIWFGERAERVRQQVLDGNLDLLCRCPGCPFVSLDQPYSVAEVEYNEYPVFLEIDLPNTHCNVGGKAPGPTSPACIMCERASPLFRPEQDHLFEVLGKIRNIVPNLRQIHVQGIAEPFYQTRENGFLLFDVLDALDFDTHRDRITLSVTTNGILLKKPVRQQYFYKSSHSITNFSIDAATSETFRKIRILDCFDLVVEHLAEFCRERAPETQHVRIHCNVNTLNVDEVVGVVRLAAETKVDCVEFNPTDGFNRAILVNEANCGRFTRAQNDIIDECNKLSVPYVFIRPLDLGMSNRLMQISL